MTEMLAYLRNEIVLVWAVLVGLTALSWWLGADHGVAAVGVGVGAATTLILVVSFVKVTMIGRTFMELRHAAPVLKALFFGLAGVICVTLVGIYLTT